MFLEFNSIITFICEMLQTTAGYFFHLQQLLVTVLSLKDCVPSFFDIMFTLAPAFGKMLYKCVSNHTV